MVVVLLTGGRPSIGPMAAGVAGDSTAGWHKTNTSSQPATAVSVRRI